MTQSNNISVNTNEIEQPLNQENAKSALFDQHHSLVNVAEVIAKEKVSEVIKRMEVCDCSKCTNDVLALALNYLPTKYVTSDAGKQYIQLNAYKKQFETDVVAALIKACLVVKSSPNHE
ncbi:late competence development ComFB family protein [Sinanaerobacter chloroacetimidivorans]|uniref:Late competence development ComFB family protein n=1 Tax=Sinanaerobacter chloroacetimidivorans TaxID=2818044 RepID=A0A8J7W225_9FIRM|nr:late competence development ComFB family protein [Sinanaerobacter chloroacetimidivorans]MBR0599444.1 late competence development ComFB family protein [Sinanaerobacter chloroacetimidivorans]